MKKLWFNILIFFGCFLLLVTTLGAVLIIAPGMELLGVMYIRSTSGSVETKEMIPDAVNYNLIEIESNNIPVVIEFVQSYSLHIKMVENFNGFAKASESPSYELTKNDEVVKIKTKEYQPFLGMASRDEGSALFVQIPMYYKKDIVVNSNNSDVKFGGQATKLKNITVNAKGKIVFGNSMEMHTLNLNFANDDVVISDSVNLSGSIIASSKRGSLTVPVGFTGSLNFTSTTGDLCVAECGQLTFSSKIGQIKGNAGKLAVINGDAKIETSGSVDIERINGAGVINTKNAKLTLGKDDELYENRLDIYTKFGDILLNGKYTNVDNVITSKSGDIDIDFIENGAVTSDSGDITIYHLDKTKVTTKSGDVGIDRSYSPITITTTSGDVNLNYANNATISTTSGDVTILDAVGNDYEISTKSGDVKLDHIEEVMSKITIYSKKGDVEVVGASGETSITTNGKVTASFRSITKPVTIKGKNKEVNVTLERACYYDLSSKKNIQSAPDLSVKTKTYNNVPNDKVINVLKIETKRGKISVTKI